ncbi:Plasma membrane t-SNARE, secretory vesicle fusion [Thoreauomyces humboldtii]|nr:Plasma membrane t-SNARE, secretory vesicle fusion [Thoreauomyces humboldtii]
MSRDRTADLRSTAPRSNYAAQSHRDVYPTGSQPSYSSRSQNGSYGGGRNDNPEMELSNRYPAAPQPTYSSNNSRGAYAQPSSRDNYPQPQSRDNGRYEQQQPAGSAYATRESPARNNSYGSSAPPAGRGEKPGMDAFFAQVEEAKDGIDRVRQNVKAIEQLHQRALVGTSQDEQAHYTRQVDELQDETSDLIQSLRNTVKRLAAETKTASPSDAGIRQQQQAGLAKRLMEVAQAYQTAQTASKQKYRARMEREIRIARPDARPDEIERALDSNTGSVFSQQLLSSRVGSQRAALAEVQTRHVEITRIEESINELFNLFQEMQAMLEAQQETIDTVEQHVDNTHVYIEDGNKEMSQAIVHRKASRKKMWWIVLCVIILLAVLVIVIYIEVVKPALDTANASKKAAAPATT